jgi:hypothetical protein
MTIFKPYFSEWLVNKYFRYGWVLILIIIGCFWWVLR